MLLEIITELGGGLIVGGAAYKVFILSPKEKPVEATPEPTNPNDAHACEVYEARALETKLVEAGIISLKELTVCSNLRCENCGDTRRAVRRLENDEILLAVQNDRVTLAQLKYAKKVMYNESRKFSKPKVYRDKY